MPPQPEAQAICLEQVSPPADPGQQTMQCVALPGDEPGLGLDAEGAICWQREVAELACELFVAADGRLALLRREGAPEVRLERQGRALDLEVDKPTFVLAGDLISVGERQLLVHLHGQAPQIAPPAPVELRIAPPAAPPLGPDGHPSASRCGSVRPGSRCWAAGGQGGAPGCGSRCSCCWRGWGG